MKRSNEKGFVLIAMSVAMLLMLATVGMAFDFGRIYIARNEAQVFTDAAALTAAVKPDAAREAIEKLPQRWNLGTKKFAGVKIEFSVDGKKWEASAGNAAFVRVTAPNNDVEITFMRAVGAPASLTVPAHSVAAVNPVRLVE